MEIKYKEITNLKKLIRKDRHKSKNSLDYRNKAISLSEDYNNILEDDFKDMINDKLISVVKGVSRTIDNNSFFVEFENNNNNVLFMNKLTFAVSKLMYPDVELNVILSNEFKNGLIISIPSNAIVVNYNKKIKVSNNMAIIETVSLIYVKGFKFIGYRNRDNPYDVPNREYENPENITGYNTNIVVYTI